MGIDAADSYFAFDTAAHPTSRHADIVTVDGTSTGYVIDRWNATKHGGQLVLRTGAHLDNPSLGDKIGTFDTDQAALDAA